MRPSSYYIGLLFAGSALAQDADLQGFSKAGLENIRAAASKWAGSGKGLVSLLARNGKILQYETYGKQGGKAVAKDSIWNMMSMTKPVSGVAMMTFYEEGKFKLDDPVSKHLPEVAKMTVGGAPQNKPMTMAMLMSHSAGFPGLIAASGATLSKGVESILRGKLAAQPGSKWAYGPGVEIQGYLMEKWAKKDFSDILQERVLMPLGMNDTGFFHAGADQRRRLITASFPSRKPARIVPSYGLHGTAMDYYKFCTMLQQEGQLNGKRILKPESVKLMRTNVLAKGVAVTMGGPGAGFGLNVAITLNPAASDARPVGSYWWAGIAGTIFWIDPANNVTWVGMNGAGFAAASTLRAAVAKAIYGDLKPAAKGAA